MIEKKIVLLPLGKFPSIDFCARQSSFHGQYTALSSTTYLLPTSELRISTQLLPRSIFSMVYNLWSRVGSRSMQVVPGAISSDIIFRLTALLSKYSHTLYSSRKKRRCMPRPWHLLRVSKTCSRPATWGCQWYPPLTPTLCPTFGTESSSNPPAKIAANSKALLSPRNRPQAPYHSVPFSSCAFK